MAEELIGPVVVKCRMGEVDSAGVAIITRDDCDIGDGGGVGEREEGKKNGKGE